MYDYIEVKIESKPCDETVTDLLAAFLADIEFESFVADESGLTAYVRKDKYNRESVEEILRDFPMNAQLQMEEKEIEGEDWNREWEQNYFQPINIDDKLVIRSSFHKEFPEIPIEIVIDPKMAFGTGHHATTAGMSRMLLEEDLKGKSIIDMGTGTGILAILGKKLEAGTTIGIDIDEFAIENAKENGELNGVEVEWLVGDDTTLENLQPADIFLANINLNVITSNLDKYVSRLREGGKIFLSGFLITDREKIMDAAKENGLKLFKEKEDKGWMTMGFLK